MRAYDRATLKCNGKVIVLNLILGSLQKEFTMDECSGNATLFNLGLKLEFSILKQSYTLLGGGDTYTVGTDKYISGPFELDWRDRGLWVKPKLQQEVNQLVREEVVVPNQKTLSREVPRTKGELRTRKLQNKKWSQKWALGYFSI